MWVARCPGIFLPHMGEECRQVQALTVAMKAGARYAREGQVDRTSVRVEKNTDYRTPSALKTVSLTVCSMSK